MQRPNPDWRRKALFAIRLALSITALAVLAWGAALAVKAAFAGVCGSLNCAPLVALEDEFHAAKPLLMAIASAVCAMLLISWTGRRADDGA